MGRISFGLILLILLSACSSIKVIPQPLANSTLQADNSLVQQKNSVQVNLQLRDMSLRPAPVEINVCSFWVEIENQRNVKLPVAPDDFVLIAADGQLYQAMDPEELLAQTKISAPYLIPYPYVGFYYLQDAYRGYAINQMQGQAPYFSSRRPEQITLDGLAAQALLPKTKTAAAIYFPAELRTMKSFKILYQVQALTGQESFPLEFAFSVEKN